MYYLLFILGIADEITLVHIGEPRCGVGDLPEARYEISGNF